MKSILLPTDFSINADHALAFASQLDIKPSVILSFLHVYDLPLVDSTKTFASGKTTQEELHQAREKIALQKFKERIKKFNLSEHPHEYYVIEGDASEQIVRVAAESEADLIIMGTHGESGDRNLFTGSVTASVIRKANCPVLAIPEGYERRKVKRIMYATELGYDETPEFLNLIDLAAKWDATVTVVHVSEDSIPDEDIMKKMTALLEKSDYPKIAISNIKTRKISSGINAYIKEHDIDMLTITTHTKSLFERIFHHSVARDMILHAHVPILIFSRAVHSKIFI